MKGTRPRFYWHLSQKERSRQMLGYVQRSGSGPGSPGRRPPAWIQMAIALAELLRTCGEASNPGPARGGNFTPTGPVPDPLVHENCRGPTLQNMANWRDCPSLAWAAQYFMNDPLGPSMKVTVYAVEVRAPSNPRDVAVVSLEVRIHSISAVAVLRMAPVRTNEHLEWLRRTMVPPAQGRLIGFWFDATTSELQPAAGPRNTHHVCTMAGHAESWTWSPEANITDGLSTCIDLFCGMGTWSVAAKTAQLTLLGGYDFEPGHGATYAQNHGTPLPLH